MSDLRDLLDNGLSKETKAKIAESELNNHRRRITGYSLYVDPSTERHLAKTWEEVLDCVVRELPLTDEQRLLYFNLVFSGEYDYMLTEEEMAKVREIWGDKEETSR